MVKLRVMSWNVWFGTPWKDILKVIQDLDPDVVCLQELTVDHPEFNPGLDVPRLLAKSLGSNHWFGNADSLEKNPTRHQYGNAIFVRGGIAITQRSQVHIQVPGEQDGRVYVEVTLGTDPAVTIGTVHASYVDGFGDTPAKSVQIERLLSAIRRHDRRFVLAGDLNAHPGTDVVRRLEETLKHAGPDYAIPTWPINPPNTPSWRPDYVFVSSDVHVSGAHVIETTFSDHYPLLAELEIV